MFLWRNSPVTVSGGFLLLVAWFAMENGWSPTAMILCAAAAHELGHFLMLRRFHVPVRQLRLTLFGAEMETESTCLSYGRELLVTLAGPLANLLCAGVLLLWLAPRDASWYAPAGAHLVLAVFNLLPIRPLDGGRAIQILLSWRLSSTAGERGAAAVGVLFAACLSAGLLCLMGQSEGNLWLLPPAVGLLCVAFGETTGGRICRNCRRFS